MFSEIPKLAPDWTPTKGLHYPLYVKYRGERIRFDNYNDHHKFIYNLYHKKPLTE